MLTFCNRDEIISEKWGNALHPNFTASCFDKTVHRKALVAEIY